MHRQQFMLIRLTVCLLVFAMLPLAGCALGPDYRRPAMPLPEAWPENTALRGEGAEDWQDWWKRFDDSTLDKLVARAVQDNPDVRMQAARVREARARLGYSTADQFPTVGIQADAIRQQASGQAAGLSQGRGPVGNLFSLAGVLSYEVDIWGRLAREREASEALLQGSVYAHEAVRLAVIAEVVGTYFSLQAARRELEITRQALGILEEMYRLEAIRFKHGQVDELVLRQAESELEATRAMLPLQHRQVRMLEGALGILTGLSPAGLMAEPDMGTRVLADIRDPGVMPLMLPSELLFRRPDIRAVEEALRAASARIGITQAERLPKLNLAALLGGTSVEADDLFTSSARTWSLGVGAAGPLLDFGRNKARVESAEAQFAQAEIDYTATVSQAFNEVRDALVFYQSSREYMDTVARQLAIARRAEELADIRYRQGLVRFIEFLDAHRTRLAAEQNLNKAVRDVFSATATLFKALGGGWTGEHDRAEMTPVDFHPESLTKR